MKIILITSALVNAHGLIKNIKYIMRSVMIALIFLIIFYYNIALWAIIRGKGYRYHWSQFLVCSPVKITVTNIFYEFSPHKAVMLYVNMTTNQPKPALRAEGRKCGFCQQFVEAPWLLSRILILAIQEKAFSIWYVETWTTMRPWQDSETFILSRVK